MAFNSTAPLGAGATASPTSSSQLQIEGDSFFESVKNRVFACEVDRNILLSIPIWGWTGDGKTCALLTALHYCRPSEHVLGLSFVTDVDELTAVEQAVDEYKDLNLVAVAATTKTRLGALSEIFIDKCEWPPGTDEATPYLLSISSLHDTLGYVVFPDLKGGSFRESDDTARAVLSKAHACIVLVNPETYALTGTEGKRYHDEIAARLRKCREANLPTCVMITRSDVYSGPDSAADEAHSNISLQIQIQNAGKATFSAQVCRVSVVGTATNAGEDGGDLPPAEDRNPEQLIRAFVWTLDQALMRPSAAIRSTVPQVQLTNVGGLSRGMAITRIPELRAVGEFSECNGCLLGTSSDDARQTAFTFADASGKLTEFILGRDKSSIAKKAAAGAMKDFDLAPESLVAHYASGEFLIGARRNADFLWHGAKGGQLVKSALPLAMLSWTPAGQRQIAGVDMSGRVHLLRFESGEWSQSKHLPGFIVASPFMTCASIDSDLKILVLNGTTIEGVKILPSGMFGERFRPALVAQYDTDTAEVNRVGLFLALTSALVVIGSISDKMHSFGQAHPEATQAFAAAPLARTFAYVGADLRLNAASFHDGSFRVTQAPYSPLLPSPPTSMAWAQDGTAVCVAYADMTWAVFQTLGLGTK